MILDFVKGFLTLFLLVKILLYFVPENTFEKYISFFSGVILVIGLIYPLLQVFGQEEVILEKLQYSQWEEQLQEISLKAEQLEEIGKKAVEEQYQMNETENQERIEIETIKVSKSTQAGEIDE